MNQPSTTALGDPLVCVLSGCGDGVVVESVADERPKRAGRGGAERGGGGGGTVGGGDGEAVEAAEKEGEGKGITGGC